MPEARTRETSSSSYDECFFEGGRQAKAKAKGSFMRKVPFCLIRMSRAIWRKKERRKEEKKALTWPYSNLRWRSFFEIKFERKCGKICVFRISMHVHSTRTYIRRQLCVLLMQLLLWHCAPLFFQVRALEIVGSNLPISSKPGRAKNRERGSYSELIK